MPSYKEFYVVYCMYGDSIFRTKKNIMTRKKNEICTKRRNILIYFQYYEKVCKRMRLNVNNKH